MGVHGRASIYTCGEAGVERDGMATPTTKARRGQQSRLSQKRYHGHATRFDNLSLGPSTYLMAQPLVQGVVRASHSVHDGIIA